MQEYRVWKRINSNGAEPSIVILTCADAEFCSLNCHAFLWQNENNLHLCSHLNSGSLVEANNVNCALCFRFGFPVHVRSKLSIINFSVLVFTRVFRWYSRRHSRSIPMHVLQFMEWWFEWLSIIDGIAPSTGITRWYCELCEKRV